MSDSPSLARDKVSMEDLITRQAQFIEDYAQHIKDNTSYLQNMHDHVMVGAILPRAPRWMSVMLVALMVVALLHTATLVFLAMRLP